MSNKIDSPQQSSLVRALGPIDATMIVIGSMIGSGIFIVSAESSRMSGAPGWLLRPFDRTPGQLACDPWTQYLKSFIGGGKSPRSYSTPPWPGEFG